MARYCSEAILVSRRNERDDRLPDVVASHRLTPERMAERRSILRGSCINILASDGKKRKTRRVCDITGMVEPWLREALDALLTGHIIQRRGKPVKNI